MQYAEAYSRGSLAGGGRIFTIGLFFAPEKSVFRRLWLRCRGMASDFPLKARGDTVYGLRDRKNNSIYHPEMSNKQRRSQVLVNNVNIGGATKPQVA